MKFLQLTEDMEKILATVMDIASKHPTMGGMQLHHHLSAIVSGIKVQEEDKPSQQESK